VVGRSNGGHAKPGRGLPAHLVPGNPGNSGGKKGQSGRPVGSKTVRPDRAPSATTVVRGRPFPEFCRELMDTIIFPRLEQREREALAGGPPLRRHEAATLRQWRARLERERAQAPPTVKLRVIYEPLPPPPEFLPPSASPALMNLAAKYAK
jgi:hypothetical protein